MIVTIDKNSGFCFGVVYAIEMAEDELDESGVLYCLGDIVHNDMEVERLQAKGLKIITHEDLKDLRDCKVLLRAHGEPPETYKLALANNITLIDASCPVVLKLQHRVRQGFDQSTNQEGQMVIYGKKGHAEVNGLVGQTLEQSIIVNSLEDLDQIDYTKPIHFFSQTTQSTAGFMAMKSAIEERLIAHGQDPDEVFHWNDTLCRQVSNREPQLKLFAKEHDVILFVSGKKSSNGKVLYQACKEANPNTYFIVGSSEIDLNWLATAQRVGICGATSTPMWLMEEVANYLKTL